MRPGWAELAAVAATDTAAAGLSTAAGEVVVSAEATARRGEPAVLALDSIAGALPDSARALPPRTNWLAGLAAAAERLGCVIVASLAAGAVWRAMVAEEGPGLAAPATWGPAFAGTSPTVVTTFVTALSVLRVMVATPDWAAVTGESIAADPLAERRTFAGVLAD
jgi:hypothetical protein